MPQMTTLCFQMRGRKGDDLGVATPAKDAVVEPNRAGLAGVIRTQFCA